jgi:hypothetical protein
MISTMLASDHPAAARTAANSPSDTLPRVSINRLAQWIAASLGVARSPFAVQTNLLRRNPGKIRRDVTVGLAIVRTVSR